MNQKKGQISMKVYAILILLVLVVIGMGSTTLLSKSVTLVYNGEELLVNTTASTVKELLEEENIDLVENIYLTQKVDAQITNDMKIEVRDPKDVIVLDNGVETKVNTGHITVEEILKDKGYTLGKNDYTVPEVKEEINFNQKGDPVIIINRVQQKRITEIVEVPFETVKEENDQLPKGETKVVTQGQNGTTMVTTEKTLLNEGEIKSTIIEEKVVKAPVQQVEQIGTKEVAAKTGGQSAKVSNGMINGKKVLKVITMQATAYDASPESNGKWAGVTALGTKLRPGVVAVDKSIIPLGSKLYVESTDSWPSYGMAVAEDVGGAIKGNRIDLFFESRDTVYSFGRRNVTVYVLEN